jgi:hypothetical protein
MQHLSEEQIAFIIADAKQKLEALIEDPVSDGEGLEGYEDEEGHCYPYCSGSDDLEVELCMDGIPGLDDADVFALAYMHVDYSYADTYDSGDYWTPPSGGWELQDSDGWMDRLDLEISSYNPETEEYENIEISDELKQRIINAVNETN